MQAAIHHHAHAHPRGSILSVPPEILHHIFDEVFPLPAYVFPPNHHSEDSYFRRITLCILSLTNSHFLSEARRLLYAEMTSRDGSSHFMFLATILRKPEYARHVRVYYTPTFTHTQRGDLWEKIRKALEIMSLLKDLVIRELTPKSDPKRIFPVQPTAAMLARRKKVRPEMFQLRRFAWLPSGRDTTEVLRFLTTQHKLTHLRWGVEAPIPTEFVPGISHKLVRLDAPTAVIHALLPGRDITEIQWNLVHLDLPRSEKAVRDWAKISEVFKMREFKELRVLALIDRVEDRRLRKGTHLLGVLHSIGVGPFPKLEVIFNHAARTRDDDSWWLVKKDAPYRTLFPGIKKFLMLHGGQDHLCLGANYRVLKTLESFTMHEHHVCEYGTYIVTLE